VSANVPLLNSFKLLQPINGSGKISCPKALPFYEGDLKIFFKAVHFETLLGYSQNEFTGPTMRLSGTYTRENTTLETYNFYYFQKTKYTFGYFGLGFGAHAPVTPRSDLTVSIRWLHTFKELALVSNYYNTDYSITNQNNRTLTENGKVEEKNLAFDPTFKNYGVSLAYQYHPKKRILLSISASWMSFSNKARAPVDYQPGLFSDEPPTLQYHLVRHDILTANIGFGFSF
jgi:hypothetical protein